MTLAACFTGFSQAAYIQPSPTGKNDFITLYINVAQTTGTLNTMLTDHPDDPVYLWTWQPAGPVIGNGDWTNSNDSMLMTKVSDKLYSKHFRPIDFYGVEATQFFSLGISCLAKLKSGTEYSGDYPGEAKTEDLHVNVIPKLCSDLYCTFPELGKKDDFLSITYDNNQETTPELQNLGPDDCYIFLRVEQSAFNAFNYAEPAAVTTTPALKMKPVEGQPGFFRITILPEDFFDGIVPETFNMKLIKYYVLKPGFTYTISPPIQAYTFLQCD